MASPVRRNQLQVSRTPSHVNLRTQQRRLRHVRSLSIRNLATPVSSPEPLAVKLKFTIHRKDSANVAFYSSSCLQETYNPMWGALLFNYSAIGEASALSVFIVKVWLVAAEDGQEDTLCFEKLVNLSHFKFLGLTMIRTYNSSYPSNCVVIGVPEGYYVDSNDGGYPSPRRPSFHRIMNFLPPQSLIEVRRTEVHDSYTMEDLKRLCAQQTRLNNLRDSLAADSNKLQAIRNNADLKIKVQEETVDLITRVELLTRLIKEQRSLRANKKERLVSTRERLDEREGRLRRNQRDLLESKMKYDKNLQLHLQKREQLKKTQRKMYLRQRVMIAELAETFCIREMNGTFTICGVILPHGDPLEGGRADQEQIGVALGFVTHLVYLLARFLLVPLQYTLRPNGSRSVVSDNVHDDQTLEFKDFPLYVKGTDKSLYQFGLYLLWRDILQLRQHCGYSSNKATLKKTLPNLKTLLDRLVKDKYSVSPLSEMSPPSISITGPTVSNPSPRTSSYFSISPKTSSFLTRGGTSESPSNNKDDIFENEESQSHGNGSVGSISLEIGSEPGSRDDESEPILFRGSPQIRRHKDGFLIKESVSSKSPESPDSFRDQEMLSQSSGKGGSLYALDVSRPLSNTDQVLQNLNSDDSKPYPCMSPEPLLFSPSPSNSPKACAIPCSEPLSKNVNSIPSDLVYVTPIRSEAIETTPITTTASCTSLNSRRSDFESLKYRNEPKNVYVSGKPKRTGFCNDTDTCSIYQRPSD